VEAECRLTLDLVPGAGYTLTGACGELLRFGVSEVVLPEALPPNACKAFRERVLSAFGQGGKRNLHEAVFVPFELGRHPYAQADEE
jgi:hypothetical protein